MRRVAGGVTAAKGYKASGVHCGLKKTKLDLAVIASEVPAAAAGVFTTNLVQAAPVKVTREHLARSGTAKAVVINSANANACTGPQGILDAQAMAAAAAEHLGCSPEEVLVSSTGVIGVPLPMSKINEGIGSAVSELSEAGSFNAAQAIMTTDTFPKEYAVEFELGDKTVRLGGIAKGSGMIHPNMATMLAFITTDISIAQPLLHKALREAVVKSFNMISVDGDTSTNDMVIVLANGQAGAVPITDKGPEYELFCQALGVVTEELAKLIVKDGEGASKFVELHVKGAQSEAAARTIARSIASSNLVKAAIFGADANWGRILCAAGYSGGVFDPDKTAVYLGELKIVENGTGVDFDEDEALVLLSQGEIVITVDLGEGDQEAKAWTCDLTYDYVKINASYRS